MRAAARRDVFRNPASRLLDVRALPGLWSWRMKSRVILSAIVPALLLASCANNLGSVGPLSPEQKKSLRLASVTAETAHDVSMEKEALDRIVKRVTAEIMAQAPNVFANVPSQPDPAALALKLVFTDYGNGDHVSRHERRNVGTTRIDADILFIDANGRTVAREQVATHFGSGGDVGLTTNILNVEDDFERSVARLLR
jgi:hypothetical protein